MNRVVSVVLCTVALAGCPTSDVNNQRSSPTPSAFATGLEITGAGRVLETDCSQYAVGVVDQAGNSFTVTADVDLTLSAGTTAAFYDDNACTNVAPTATILNGDSSVTLYLFAQVAGAVTLDAADANGNLDAAQLKVSVDALLLAAYDSSILLKTFTSAAWITLDREVGTPMQATVTVPSTGVWYIEVRARATIREPNNSFAIRMRETSLAGASTVDYVVRNANDGETTSGVLFYVNTNPTAGETYTYIIEGTGRAGTGTNHEFNPANLTHGPVGDQVVEGRSSIMAVVRPGRGLVE